MSFSTEVSKFPVLLQHIVNDVAEYIEKKGSSPVNFNEIMNSKPVRYKSLVDLPKQDKSILIVVGKLMESLVGILVALEKLPGYTSSNASKVIPLLKASSPDLKRSILLISAVYKFVSDLPLKSKE